MSEVNNLYDMYSTDTEAETGNGITLNFGVAKFHVRRAGGANKRFSETLRKLSNPLRRQIQNDTVRPEQLNEIFQRCYARSVVIGWEGVTDREGTILDFSEANFVRVMTDLPDLWAQLQEECTKISNFRIGANEEDGEQLGNSSYGTSSGEVH